jgi:hypothetical protein
VEEGDFRCKIADTASFFDALKVVN